MTDIKPIMNEQWHRDKGAVFEEFFGIQIPSHYGNAQEEYRVIRENAALRDVSYFGKIRMSGRDRNRFLNGMVTNEIKSLQQGSGVFALFLDVKGRIQADMKVYAFPDHLLLVLQHYLKDRLIEGLDKYIISEDVRMTDLSNDLGMVQVLGPEAPAKLSALGFNLPEQEYSWTENELAGVKVFLIRLGAAFALVAPAEQTALVMDALKLPPAGMRAFETFRIESGLPLSSRDFDETNLPQESRLDRALNFQKGCYLGQETIARLDAQGHVNKLLTGFSAPRELSAGEKLYKGDREVGRVTSSTFSPILNSHLALGYIRREFSSAGESLEAGDDRTTVVVKDLPLK